MQVPAPLLPFPSESSQKLPSLVVVLVEDGGVGVGWAGVAVGADCPTVGVAGEDTEELLPELLLVSEVAGGLHTPCEQPSPIYDVQL